MTSTTTTTGQVSINMENANNANKQTDLLTTGMVSVDGPHSNRTAGHRRHNSHGSNGSGHRNHSVERDDDDRSRHQHRNHQHRERRRSRSPSHSHSPSRRKRSIDHAVPSTEKDIRTNTHDVGPLLETEIHRKVKQTELDEDSDDSETDTQHEDNSGVDDGFIVGDRNDTGNDFDNNKNNVSNNNTPHQPNGGNEVRPFPTLPPSFFGPNIILDAEGNPRVIPDINVYQQKKNLAQGMMDLALLSANANQLRYVLETFARHPYFWFSFTSIILSLILQVAVGVGLILNSRYNIKNKEEICRADRINNFTIIGIFLITTVNVFITAFGVADPPTSS